MNFTINMRLYDDDDDDDDCDDSDANVADHDALLRWHSMHFSSTTYSTTRAFFSSPILHLYL